MPAAFPPPITLQDLSFPSAFTEAMAPVAAGMPQEIDDPSKAGPAAAEVEYTEVYHLPLYPKWLPEGYSVEGLHLLNYQTSVDGEKSSKLVYQFEILGPLDGSALSIFEVRAEEMDFEADSVNTTAKSGYIIKERGDWLVTVVGGLPKEVLEQIVDGLAASDSQVADLLELTRRQDLLLREVTGDS